MRLAPSLREATRRLSAPPGARLRILEELRGDLEDLQATLRAAGVPEAEARRRAEQLLVPGDTALSELSAVHRPLWIRWQSRLPHQVGWPAVALSGLAGAIGLIALANAAGLSDLPLFLVPLAGIAAAALVRVGTHVVRVWVLGDSEPARMRAGIGDLLVAAVGATAASASGVLIELYRTASRISTAPDLELVLAIEWVRRSVVLGAAGMVVALACGTGWLFFARRAAVVEQRERALLGPDLVVVPGSVPAPETPAGGSL